MQQNTLKPSSSQTKKRKRIGRGNGSCGTYSGRGMKGQTARSGGRRRPGFEGGQTPLIRKMPKLRGFKHPFAKEKANQVVNLSDLEATFQDGDTVDKAKLLEVGLIATIAQPVKLLGNGKLAKKLTITVDTASQSAQTSIEKAGGKLTVLAVKEEKSAPKKGNKKKHSVLEDETSDENNES